MGVDGLAILAELAFWLQQVKPGATTKRSSPTALNASATLISSRSRFAAPQGLSDRRQQIKHVGQWGCIVIPLGKVRHLGSQSNVDEDVDAR
jgi:hypothetical protein